MKRPTDDRMMGWAATAVVLLVAGILVLMALG